METTLLTLLEVHHWTYNKIRLGKNNDGGYVICNIPNIEYDSLLSCGISNDI